MKKILKILAVAAVLVLIGIQFMRPERRNPPVDPAQTLEAHVEVPPDIRGILERSCKDCHTNRTDFPWYSNVAPVSWEVVGHIDHGREELNFSEWGTYSRDRQERKLEEICDEVEAREMPHNQYLWIHWDAELSDRDIEALCGWTKEAAAALEN